MFNFVNKSLCKIQVFYYHRIQKMIGLRRITTIGDSLDEISNSVKDDILTLTLSGGNTSTVGL